MNRNRLTRKNKDRKTKKMDKDRIPEWLRLTIKNDRRIEGDYPD